MISALTRLRSRIRTLVLAQRVALVLAAALAACLAIGLADYILRTPSWLRVIVWAGGLSALAWAAVNLVWPAVKFRPPLSELALRVERGPAGQEAGLRGVLAAGVELASARERGDLPERSASLAEPVVAEAARRYERVRASDVLTGRQTWRSAGLLGAAAAVTVLIGVLAPSLLVIGAVRVLAPWSVAQWPKRTAVVDATAGDVHPLGEALALRAVVARRGAGPEAASASRVWAFYRVTDSGGSTGPTRSVLLTSQDKVEPMPPREGEIEVPAGRRGVLFERLVEPAALASAEDERAEGVAVGGVGGVLEYWFETDDDRTPAARVRLVEPPAVLAAAAEITPPAYARAGDGAAREIDLGPGSDERAAPAAMLAGSHIRLSLELNKDVPDPNDLDEVAQRTWLAVSLGPDVAALADEGALTARFEGRRWELEWVLRQSARIPVRVTDEFGLASVEEPVYRLEAAQDEPPTVTVTAPESDRTVLPTAVVDVRGEARDDVGLAWAALERRRAMRPRGSQGAPAEPVEEWTGLVRTDAGAPSSTGARELIASAQVDLAAMGVVSGEELWLTAVAGDTYQLDGQSHEPSRSAVRRLVVISPEEFAAQVWAELGGLRRAAVRLDEEQERLSQRMAPGRELGAEGAEEVRRGQAAITERLAREREALQRLTRRMEENRFEDAELQGVVGDAGEMLEEAGKQSVEASTAVEDAARAEESGRPATDEQKAGAVGEQRDVRDQLGELADLLDRGRDTWALRRAIERALEDQKALRERTGETAANTAGKGDSELSPQERRSLDQIAQEQQDLAGRTREALQRMEERKEEIEQNDPAAAKAVEQAAERGRQEQVPERMEEAAQQVQQNQGNSATSQQDQAIQSLEQMLEDLEQGAASQDEELRRILADLIESIELLIHDQERQLAMLGERRETEAYEGLAEGMVRLSLNTLRVVEEANAGPRELAPVAELLDRAADAQGAAVISLRADPVNPDEAQGQEQISLERLQRALDEAKKIDEEAAEREAERKRQALKKAYREALAEQVAIAEETQPLVGVEANRRTRATARALGDRQEALRQTLVDLQASTQELAEAVMFSFAHDRIDTAMAGAAKTLGEGAADAAVRARQDSAIRTLQAILDALESDKQDEEFRENPEAEEGGGGGGGGSPPVIPPGS
ncbi:MAG TPA: hypothetical protein VEB65_09825, partial [Solirubrobacterales bacterium]|nr:hypothetical protein [Solirubrobacterales bacterium]